MQTLQAPQDLEIKAGWGRRQPAPFPLLPDEDFPQNAGLSGTHHLKTTRLDSRQRTERNSMQLLTDDQMAGLFPNRTTAQQQVYN